MAVDATLVDILDGDGYASPLGTKAKELGLGTLIAALEARIAALEGEIGAGGTLTVNTINEATAASGVTVDGCLIKDGRAAALATAALFLSGEITGNGSAQNTAHGLGAVPTLCVAIPIESAGAFDVAAGTHTTTNAVFTMTNAVKYRVLAIL